MVCHLQNVTEYNYLLSWSRIKYTFTTLEKKACFRKAKVKNEVGRKFKYLKDTFCENFFPSLCVILFFIKIGFHNRSNTNCNQHISCALELGLWEEQGTTATRSWWTCTAAARPGRGVTTQTTCKPSSTWVQRTCMRRPTARRTGPLTMTGFVFNRFACSVKKRSLRKDT